MYFISSLLLPKDQVLQHTFTPNTTMYLRVAAALECGLAPWATGLLSHDPQGVSQSSSTSLTRIPQDLLQDPQDLS